MIVNDPTKTFHTIPGYYDSNFNQISTYSNLNDMSLIQKDLLIHKLQTLKITKNIEEQQYKSILGMLASPDERDQEMARLSIRTLWDELL